MFGKKKVQRGFDDYWDAYDWFFVPHRDHYRPSTVSKWFKKRRMKSRLLIPHTGRWKSTSNFMILGRRR